MIIIVCILNTGKRWQTHISIYMYIYIISLSVSFSPSPSLRFSRHIYLHYVHSMFRIVILGICRSSKSYTYVQISTILYNVYDRSSPQYLHTSKISLHTAPSTGTLQYADGLRRPVLLRKQHINLCHKECNVLKFLRDLIKLHRSKHKDI